MAATGVAILFVSHHLDEVFAVADRVTVLRDGRHVTTVETAASPPPTWSGTCSAASSWRRRLRTERTAAHGRPRPVLSARGLGGTVAAALDLDVLPGEVVGVAGLTGSGREELRSRCPDGSPGPAT